MWGNAPRYPRIPAESLLLHRDIFYAKRSIVSDILLENYSIFKEGGTRKRDENRLRCGPIMGISVKVRYVGFRPRPGFRTLDGPRTQQSYAILSGGE